MAKKLGLDGKLYRAGALLAAADEAAASGATWTEITNCKDVSLGLEQAEADVTTRANNGWRQTLGTLKEGTVEFQMVYDPSDASIAFFMDAYMNNDEVAVAIMDGAIATVGNQGLVSNFTVLNVSRDESLEEAMMLSVTLKPSSFTQWYEVAAP